MINKKVVIGLFLISSLGACTSPTALVGPAYTLSSSGNIFQAGFSYGSTEFVKMHTGKTPIENIKDAIKEDNQNIYKKTLESEDFFVLIENQIKKTSGILNLSTQ
jgi:hypothetical protein